MTVKKDFSQQDPSEQTRFKKFLDGLHVFPNIPKFPIRNWMAWLGIVLFVIMVIVYYAMGGGK